MLLDKAATIEEKKEIVKEVGIEPTDEEMEQVSGGNFSPNGGDNHVFM